MSCNVKLTQDEANTGQIDASRSLHAELVMHLTVDVPEAGVWLTQWVTVIPPHHTAALLLQGLSDLERHSELKHVLRQDPPLPRLRNSLVPPGRHPLPFSPPCAPNGIMEFL